MTYEPPDICSECGAQAAYGTMEAVDEESFDLLCDTCRALLETPIPEWTVAAESGEWWPTTVDYQDIEPTEFNARLMAAAPGLLRTLLAISRECQGDLSLKELMACRWAVLDLAQTAIKQTLTPHPLCQVLGK